MEAQELLPSKPKFKMGKIVNKYLIIEISGYAFDEHLKICINLYSTSKQLRLLLVENYSLTKSILQSTHFDIGLRLTFDWKTSEKGHEILKQLMERKFD